jgi:predicted Zn-dependent protease
MCRKPLTKEQRIAIYVSEPGGDVQRKKHDVCEKCMKTIEKNIKIWYDKIVNKNK